MSDAIRQEHATGASAARGGARPPGGVLGAMRIRKKLIYLHTWFSLGLAVILLVSLRPALARVIDRAEVDEAEVLLRSLVRYVEAGGEPERFVESVAGPASVGSVLRLGTSEQLRIGDEDAQRLRGAGREMVRLRRGNGKVEVAVRLPGPGVADERFALATTWIGGAREAVVHLFVLLVVALLTVYGLVALALEVFVMPQHVYDPIRRMREADRAVREGRREQELIPESLMPRDELGEIMRSRNDSVRELRKHESALAAALAEIERVASDLKRKNHLLERAQQNLRDADRLASLGMMSAGIAHELNTPLAVLKGLVETLARQPRAGMEESQAALMLRVVKRLERLGESLLDFARVRPPTTRRVVVRELVDEAITLARLNREAGDIEMVNLVPEGLDLDCDADRMVQVLVNLVRNAVDAMRRARGAATSGPRRGGRIVVGAGEPEKGRGPGAWVSITVTDDGPGIDPDILARLFEPFASTELDAKGTGLGLAVSEGIVREHGGVLLARNRTDAPSGAVFEVVMPRTTGPGDGAPEGGASAGGSQAGG